MRLAHAAQIWIFAIFLGSTCRTGSSILLAILISILELISSLGEELCLLLEGSGVRKFVDWYCCCRSLPCPLCPLAFLILMGIPFSCFLFSSHIPNLPVLLPPFTRNIDLTYFVRYLEESFTSATLVAQEKLFSQR